MRIIKTSEFAIKEAVTVLKRGGLIIYPTETLYGAGVDATNPKAVEKLTKYKNRPLGKPYSIAVANQNMAEDYVELNKIAKNIYKEFLPGPLTVISRGKHEVAQKVESEDGNLGVRIPNYKLVIDIVKNLKKPITATSANASYKRRPYKICDILENLSQKQKDLIDLIIDAGELPKNDPSTVIDTTLDDPMILRQGEIKMLGKEDVLSKSEESTQNLAKEIWQKNEKHKGQRAIIFALEGDMGVGKTQFTKGLAKAMEIKDLVTSPTFALENEYGKGQNKLFHFDAWRIEDQSELSALGFEELIKNKSVVVIEWAGKVADVVRDFDDEAIIIWVRIEFGRNENDRLIKWGNI